MVMVPRAGRAPDAAAALASAVLALLLLAACNPQPEATRTMPERDIETVMNAHVDRLMALSGVAAVAIGLLPDHTPCIKVYVVELTADLAGRIPDALEGHPVVVEESGEIRPFEGGGS
jgi:hypothetical protein